MRCECERMRKDYEWLESRDPMCYVNEKFKARVGREYGDKWIVFRFDFCGVVVLCVCAWIVYILIESAFV